MFAVYLLLLLLLLLLNKILYNTLIRSNSLFNLTWCMCGALASLGIFGLNKPILLVHILTIVCILSFNIVYMFTSYKKPLKKLQEDQSKPNEPNYRIIIAANIVAWIFTLPFIGRSITLIREYGFSGLRSFAYVSSDALASTAQLTIFQNIIEPIFTITVLLCMIELSYKRLRKSIVIFALLDISVYTLLFGGRAMIMEAGIFVFLSLWLRYRSFEKNFISILIKEHKPIILLMIIAFGGLVYLTTKRSIQNMSFLANVMVYFVGPFAFLSELIKDNNALSSGFLFGKAIFGWILSLFSIIVKLVFGMDYNGADYLISQITAPRRLIGDGITFNALPTMLFPFIKDFGYLGSIIGPALYALVIVIIETKYYKGKSLFWLALFIYALYGIPFTIMNYYYMSAQTIIFLIILFVFTNKFRFKQSQ